jgi:hypothetical protein
MQSVPDDARQRKALAVRCAALVVARTRCKRNSESLATSRPLLCGGVRGQPRCWQRSSRELRRQHCPDAGCKRSKMTSERQPVGCLLRLPSDARGRCVVPCGITPLSRTSASADRYVFARFVTPSVTPVLTPTAVLTPSENKVGELQ